MYRNIVLTAAALALTVAAACPAAAQLPTRTVCYHDLDLTTARGVRILRHRLSLAAGYVCRFASAGETMLKSEYQQCREDVAAAAKPKIVHAVELAQARAAATEFASR